jgi:hypothetical protein
MVRKSRRRVERMIKKFINTKIKFVNNTYVNNTYHLEEKSYQDDPNIAYPIEKPKWLGDTININIFGNKIDYIPIIWGYI